jgi:NADH pyrophosphatase NudC (nudix superfamily)
MPRTVPAVIVLTHFDRDALAAFQQHQYFNQFSRIDFG